MSTLASRGYPEGSRELFKAHAQEPHTVEWRITVVRWKTGGGSETLAEDVPIIRGTLTLDSSDLIRRRLSVEVGGGEQWAPTTPDSPLVPFGQRILLDQRIDDGMGGWLPWLRQGEFWITTHVFERPSLITTIEAVDYSGAVNEYRHLNKRGYRNRTVRAAIEDMVQAALPNGGFNTIVTASGASNTVSSYVADSGMGRWESAVDLGGKHGVDPLFDANGNLVLRRELTDEDDVLGAGGNGPDIGSSGSPVAVFRDGIGGNLIAMTSTVTRDGGCNGVQINVHGTVKRKKKDVDVTRSVQVLETRSGSPVLWGDQFGRVPIVIDENVDKITSDLMDKRRTRAKNLLQRRRGLVRYIDFDAAPLYWVEPDDRVKMTWTREDGSTLTEYHFVQRVEFTLEGGPIRLRTRQLSVTDPGAGS